MASGIRKRSLTVAGHRTSISLEEVFWRALKEVATEQGRAPADLVAEIDAARGAARASTGLSSAVRAYLLEHYRRRGA